jgi:hypothetical protein
MGLIYRASSYSHRVAEIVVESPIDIVCILRDNALKTQSKVGCSTLRQAMDIVDKFLTPKNYL